MNINPIQIMQLLPSLKSNPMAMLGQFGVPQNISNDPQAVIQNLMNNGRITQDQYNQAMQMAKNMGARL